MRALPTGVQMHCILKHFNPSLAVELQTPRGETESLWQNKTQSGEVKQTDKAEQVFFFFCLIFSLNAFVLEIKQVRPRFANVGFSHIS